MRETVFLLGIVLILAAGGCVRRDDPPPAAEEGSIDFGRNSEFSGPRLRVFLTLEDGGEASVDTADDAVRARPGVTPLPGHEARDWMFVKHTGDGTSVAHALVSRDSGDPADCPMAGWWAQFPGQHPSALDFSMSEQYALVDGPEIDPSNPPRPPMDGRATYVGQAGGLYAYVPGSDWGTTRAPSCSANTKGRSRSRRTSPGTPCAAASAAWAI